MRSAHSSAQIPAAQPPAPGTSSAGHNAVPYYRPGIATSIIGVALTLALTAGAATAVIAAGPHPDAPAPQAWWGSPVQTGSAPNAVDNAAPHTAPSAVPRATPSDSSPAIIDLSAEPVNAAPGIETRAASIIAVQTGSAIHHVMDGIAFPVANVVDVHSLSAAAQKQSDLGEARTASGKNQAPAAKPSPAPVTKPKPQPIQTPAPKPAPPAKPSPQPSPSASPKPKPSPSPTPTPTTPAPTQPPGGELPKVASGNVIGEGGTVASNKALAQRLAQQNYGWGADQFQCLDQLWQRESGWNHRAANSRTAARGIAQTMMTVHFRNLNPATGVNEWWQSATVQEFLNSPQRQITWGLNYINGRYKSPCGAKEHWQVENWY